MMQRHQFRRRGSALLIGLILLFNGCNKGSGDGYDPARKGDQPGAVDESPVEGSPAAGASPSKVEQSGSRDGSAPAPGVQDDRRGSGPGP